MVQVNVIKVVAIVAVMVVVLVGLHGEVGWIGGGRRSEGVREHNIMLLSDKKSVYLSHDLLFLVEHIRTSKIKCCYL